jgi:hypothetical protein
MEPEVRTFFHAVFLRALVVRVLVHGGDALDALLEVVL